MTGGVPVIVGGTSHAALRRAAALRLSVALQSGQPGDLAELARLGVDELVLVEPPPENPDVAEEWVAALARRWRPPTRVDTDR